MEGQPEAYFEVRDRAMRAAALCDDPAFRVVDPPNPYENETLLITHFYIRDQPEAAVRG